MPNKPEPRPKKAPRATPPVETPSTGKAPSRTTINFVLDATLLVMFVVLSINALVVRFVFPRATAAHGWSVWGFGLDDWLDGQIALFGVFAILVLVHVMLHWNWVCGVVTSRLARRWPKMERADDGVKTIYGVGLLIVLLAIVGVCVGTAALMVAPPG